MIERRIKINSRVSLLILLLCTVHLVILEELCFYAVCFLLSVYTFHATIPWTVYQTSIKLGPVHAVLTNNEADSLLTFD